MRYTTILFDFDGTLADTAEGIFESVQYALRKMGLPQADIQTMRRFIGPPLPYSFSQFIGLSPDEAEQAVLYYRENYAAGGKYKLSFYPGMLQLLRDLRDAGKNVCIASAKPDLFIRQILEYYKIDGLFTCVQGAPMQEQSSDKSSVIRSVMNRCNAEDKRTVLMVGDTAYDIRAAKKVGIDSAGVLYGYGSRAELAAEGAEYLAQDVEDLRNNACFL
ncbi:MAG: HAD hydrolase-like protein [Clostridia bacterium]|nr:HAD hydrolase-like protein [Clostridia bacterium]